MRHPAALLALAGAAVLAFGGCGIPDPYHSHTSTSTSTSSATASRSTALAAPQRAASAPAAKNPAEREGIPPADAVRISPNALAPSPQTALARFARLYVNWSAAQLPVRARQLTVLCTGQAQGQALRLAARATVLDRYQVTNSGSVVAIAPGQGAEQGRWVVVTNELTSGAGPYLGLPATSHVTWATLNRQHDRYVISGWYPAS